MTVEFPNLRHLRAFKEVAERQSVSAAAAHVHLSQPAVTQAIGGLESRLELSLFDRRAEGMFATSAGQVFLTRVQRMFDHLESGSRQATQSAKAKSRGADTSFLHKISASQLRALIAIWETGSFSLAARKVGIAQPSVHRAARDLEKLAGVTFYTMSRKGVDLTQAAEDFARSVKIAAAELQQGYDEITLSRGQDSTRITVGSMPLSRTSILPQSIHDLMKENAGVQIRTVEGPYDELLRSLRYGDLDFLIGAMRDPAPSDDVLQETLFDDPLAIVAGPQHPLAGRNNLTLKDAMQFPWIAPPRTTPSGSYLYRRLGIGGLDNTPVRVVSSSLVLIRGLLARGDYVTIMSRHQIAIERAEGLMVPLDIALPSSLRGIGVTTRDGWMPTPTQARFLDLVRAAATTPYT
ncbi:LysR family transcriptional regulator [uncultured Shimia sp.]|uniref:LysR family transcriptional regulator n=1 Tax=uncultured Shimia sp. TaxID=573152 RepID=UPI00262ED844|nr:LysR family transcriptional regulator [uncultured Shimia sp.]